MIRYRLADEKYMEDVEGIGAKLFGGRWNEVNTPCIYTSKHLSLAFLEKFVPAHAKENRLNIALLTIEIPVVKDAILTVDDQRVQKNGLMTSSIRNGSAVESFRIYPFWGFLYLLC